MFYNAILAWTLLLPTTWALIIESHITTSTTLLCTTTYGNPSLLSIPTTISPSPETIELSPVILHNTTTLTKTITPKPFSTLFSILTAKTMFVTREPVNGTFYSTVTRFGTSTFWYHVTSTQTETKYRHLTSRTTSWVGMPSGFVPVRNSSSFATVNDDGDDGGDDDDDDDDDAKKRDLMLTHPHLPKRQQTKKPKLVKPTEGSYAVGVGCVQQVQLHTTEILLLTESTRTTVTLRPETVYKNRTVYGTITSTILLIPTTTTSLPTSSTSSTSSLSLSSPILSKRNPTTQSPPSPTPPEPLDANSDIHTNLTTLTLTPYTITFTHTDTITSTQTSTRHATTTLTSHLACSTPNLLSQTPHNQRINGISVPAAAILERSDTTRAGGCCENCVQRKGCLWGVWEAEGRDRGACYLVVLEHGREGERGGRGESEENEGVCYNQEGNGTFGYTARNGEIRYVVSNGLCGRLREA